MIFFLFLFQTSVSTQFHVPTHDLRVLLTPVSNDLSHTPIALHLGAAIYSSDDLVLSNRKLRIDSDSFEAILASAASSAFLLHLSNSSLTLSGTKLRAEGRSRFINADSLSEATLSNCELSYDTQSAIPFFVDGSILLLSNISLSASTAHLVRPFVEFGKTENIFSFSKSNIHDISVVGGPLLGQSASSIGVEQCKFINVTSNLRLANEEKVHVKESLVHSCTFEYCDNMYYGTIVNADKSVSFEAKNSSFSHCTRKYYDKQVVVGASQAFDDCEWNDVTTANDGGAISIGGPYTVTIKSCTFAACSTQGAYTKGGAIKCAYSSTFGTTADLTITKTEFANCSAPSSGGALYYQSQCYLSTSNFTSNSAEFGGHIFAIHKGGSGTFYDNMFISGEVTSMGGAVYVQSTTANMNFSYCTFSKCKAGTSGGAIYFDSDQTTTSIRIYFSHLKFLNNSVSPTTTYAGNDIYYCYQWHSMITIDSFAYCSSTSSSPKISEKTVGNHDAWMDNVPSNNGLEFAKWIIALIVAGAVIAFLTPAIICLCFCCHCACFAARGARPVKTSYAPMPNPTHTQVYVQGYATPQSSFQAQAQPQFYLGK